MDHVLSTERLVLRPVTADDHAVLLEHWTQPDVRRFLFDGTALSAAEVAETIEESIGDFAARGYGIWLIEFGPGTGLVGTAGLRPLEDSGLEIFYSLALGAWGQGYATEAARAVMEYGLGPLGLAEVLTEVDEGNTASVAVVKRLTVTDQHGHAIGHGCARPAPTSRRTRAGPGPPGQTRFSVTPASRDRPPGEYGTWTLRVPGDRPDLMVAIDTLATQDCEHRYEARGHDPGVRLRHLSQIRHATCTSPVCRRPASQCDFEHNTPYEAGGRTCLCNGGPKCRHDHRLKQHPKWTVDQLPDGTFTWTTPAGRTYATEPTRYPI